MEKLPLHVVHYGANDPESVRGGVEAFARRLRLVFDRVTFMTPRTIDVALVERERLPVICDNQFVLDWPSHIPVIGFQHGVAAVKFRSAPSLGRWRLARRQARAAKRPNVVWVACAAWIGETFGSLHGNRAAHVIHNPVDPGLFDGRLENEGSRLILHDARLKHKGSRLVPRLARAFPNWRFEPLDCAPHEVPARMRRAAAFLHLSRYEGNSIVCAEAMAMNLPCFFTRVGLMVDDDRPRGVHLIDPRLAYRDPGALEREFRRFTEALGQQSYRPRDWILRNATPEANRDKWAAAVDGLWPLWR